MANATFQINVYHDFIIENAVRNVNAVYSLFTIFGKYLQKVKSRYCVKERNPAESKDSGCQKTEQIDPHCTGNSPCLKQQIDTVDGNSSHGRPKTEIQKKFHLTLYSHHKKYHKTCACNHQDSCTFFHPDSLPLSFFLSTYKVLLFLTI